jgi:hypothetical protein
MRRWLNRIPRSKNLKPIARKLNPDSPALASLLAAGALATLAVKQYQESVNLYNEAITIGKNSPRITGTEYVPHAATVLSPMHISVKFWPLLTRPIAP